MGGRVKLLLSSGHAQSKAKLVHVIFILMLKNVKDLLGTVPMRYARNLVTYKNKGDTRIYII